MKGVEKVGVDFKKSTATVWMKKGHHLQRKSVEVALKKSGGFGVKNVEAYAQPKKKAKKKAKKG
ncbi:MAG: hypothetical protein CMJ83_09875 [Planctomycetes bacterium]|jgi:hypothetical protein|nr:hypothetical protein [Planctomycetota bacterium]